MKKSGMLGTRSGILIGIDEAGRGPLAGPIAVGAFAVKSRSVLRKFRGVKDSKQLTSLQRDVWFDLIKREWKRGNVSFAVSFCHADSIDERGLTWATCTSMNRALRRLEKVYFQPTDLVTQEISGQASHVQQAQFFSDVRVLLDGSLYAPSRYIDQRTIIDGDAKVKVIALASICAKVLRDRKMVRRSRQYPQYGFEFHKGYGTKKHYEAIRKYGLSPLHRASFLKRMKA